VTLSDLTADDKGFFGKDHGNHSPGLVNFDFYNDKKSTLALVLTSGEGANQKAELVVARKLGDSWRTTRLDSAGSSIPVVWR